MAGQKSALRERLSDWHLRRVPFPAVPFVDPFGADPVSNGSVFAVGLREEELDRIRVDILRGGNAELVQPWSWIWGLRHRGRSIGMGKTALLTHIADQINADFGKPFFGYGTNWLAVYVPVHPGSRSAAELAASALASLCKEARGMSVVRLLLGKLRHTVITLGLIGTDVRGLRTASPLRLAKDKWVAEQGIDLGILSHAVESHLTAKEVTPAVAHAVATGTFHTYLANLGHNPNLLPPAAGLVTHALSLLLNDVARIAQLAGIRKLSFLVDDFYKLIYRAPNAQKTQLATEIRALAVDGPYFAVNHRLFNWVAIIHSHYAATFNAHWESARMNQVARLSLDGLDRDEHARVVLKAIPLEKGPTLLEAYLSYDRPRAAPSSIYPFTGDALAMITQIAGEQVGNGGYDPGSLLQRAWQVTCEALMCVPDPAPISAGFVEYVLRGKQLPEPRVAADEDEPDREELVLGTACPCSCHTDDDIPAPNDAMAHKAGASGTTISYRCAACNAPVRLDGAA